MARKPKLHVPGGVYHVMLRGNGGKNIFYTQKDRDHLEELVGEGVIRYGLPQFKSCACATFK